MEETKRLRVSLNEARLIHKHTKSRLTASTIDKAFTVEYKRIPKTLVAQIHNHVQSQGYKLVWSSPTMDRYEK